MPHLRHVDFWDIKPEIRVIGIDDGSFKPRARGKVLVVGAIFRGGLLFEGVLSTDVDADGMDATQRIVEMINRSRHKSQLRVIMTEGITLAGFNVINVKEVFEQTGLPVIVVTREKPNIAEVKQAIKHLPDWQDRWKLVRGAGKIMPVVVKKGLAPIYLQCSGIKRGDAEHIVRITSTHALVPEPLRVAHIIATGIARGESVGRV